MTMTTYQRMREYHAQLTISRGMEVCREEYLDYMTFQANERPLFTEIFGPLLPLKAEWIAQGATPEEMDFSAFRYRRAMSGPIPVNTGWVGGRFGVGKRISIRHTRNLLNAALEGKLDNVKYRKDKLFGFEVPTECPDVPPEVLDPAGSWGSKEEYWKKYDAMAARYIENFKLFEDGCPPEIAAAGPKRLDQPQ